MAAPSRNDFRFLERLRVRWVEVDLQQIVFNGHYLMYFDTAVGGYWRALALPYHETMAAFAGDIYVRKATLEYEASARYDDLLSVGVRCARIGNSSLVFQGAVFRGEQCLVHGELLYVFADPKTQTSRPVPQALRDWMLGYEAGEPVLRLQAGNWDALGADVVVLRQMVFGEELGAPEAAGMDEQDCQALQVVAYNRAGLALACGRLLPSEAGISRVGRMATRAALRGGGIARQVLNTLMEAAWARGDEAVQVLAAPSAVTLYERAGFVATGSVIDAAGQRHIEMLRRR